MNECFDVFLHSAPYIYQIYVFRCWGLTEWFSPSKVTTSTQRSEKLRSRQNQRIFKIIFYSRPWLATISQIHWKNISRLLKINAVIDKKIFPSPWIFVEWKPLNFDWFDNRPRIGWTYAMFLDWGFPILLHMMQRWDKNRTQLSKAKSKTTDRKHIKMANN